MIPELFLVLDAQLSRFGGAAEKEKEDHLMRSRNRARHAAELERRNARIAELEAALSPFASTARAITWPTFDAQPIITAGFLADARIGTTWGDWKRAAAAMPDAQPQPVVYGFLRPDGQIAGKP